MARYLALDWDHGQLHLVAADVRGGGIRVQATHVWPATQTPNLGEAEALGKFLKERLKIANIAPAPVLACVGRDRVIFKELRYPNVPPHEEPNIVRFQITKEISEPIHEVTIDYTSRLSSDGKGDRRCQALVVRKEFVAACQKLCQSAGLKLAALTPRPFAMAAALQRQVGTSVLTPAPTSPDAAVAFLVLADKWAEFCIIQGGFLLQSRSLTIGNALAGEVRRSLAVYSGQPGQQPVTALYLANSGERADLRDRLQDMLQVPVHLFDPFGQAERPDLPNTLRSGFTGAVGLLYAQSTPTHQAINFVKPKEPKPPADPNQRKYKLVGTLAAVAALAVVGWMYLQVSELDRRVAQLAATKLNLDNQMKTADLEDKRFIALKEWSDSEVVWLDELYDLTDRVPDINTLQIAQLTGDPIARTAKSKHAAKMTVVGTTTNEPKHVDALMAELVRDNHYRVEPKKLVRNPGSDRFRFAQQFTAKVDIEKLPPDKYNRKIEVPEPPRPQGRGGNRGADLGDFGGGMGGFGGFGGFGGRN